MSEPEDERIDEQGDRGDPASDIEALLFLSPSPVSLADLADACEVEEAEVESALAELEDRLGDSGRGLILKRVAGCFALASAPGSERAARRLLARPRTPPLTRAQAETLAIVAYLQPVARPEIARIRGVSSESAVASLGERGLIEESGKSRFGAVLYRTSELFEKLFGLDSLDSLPDPSKFDPDPADERAIRERLLSIGEQRVGS